jgi:hypothetical protein
MTQRSRLAPVLVLLLLLAPPGVARGQVLDEARQMLLDGEGEAALTILKQHRSLWTERPDFALLAARAYAATGNTAWAKRTLMQCLRQHPGDCDLRAELAWLMLSGAEFRGARDVLVGAGCPGTPEEEVRWLLLGAMAARQAKEPEALRAHVAAARRGQRMYPEDRALLGLLERAGWPLRTPAMELRAGLSGGWRSNPLLGSPLDQQASDRDFASAYTEMEAWGRFASPHWGPLGLFLEGDAEGRILYAEVARDLSHAGWGLRPGVELSWPSVALRSAYHFDALWVATADAYGDRDSWFYDGHRGELELELALGLTAFAGAGHRRFRSMGRSRWEVDFGVGGGGQVGTRLSLLGAVTGRRHRARNAAYNVWGGTALLSSRVRVFGSWALRMMASAALDDYPDSAGAEAFHAAKRRRDVQVRGRIGLWSPPFLGGLQAGVRYQPTRRFSTAPLYDFMDHTVVVLISCTLSGSPWVPRLGPEVPGRIPLDLRAGGGEDVLGERLQDLLRQDEEAQRGSSCMD